MDISKTLEGKITGGHMLARAMAAKGVKKVFALCGGFINPIFMGCHDYGIEVVGCRNEMEAGFMAAAYARVTREPGDEGVIFAAGTENSGVSIFIQNDKLVVDHAILENF